MSKIARAKFFLDKALNTQGYESFEALQILISLLSDKKVLEAVLLTEDQLHQIGGIAVLEFLPDFIRKGIRHIDGSPGYALQTFRDAERLISEFDLTVPESWLGTIKEGKRFARISEAFDEAERTVDSRYPFFESDRRRETVTDQWSRRYAVRRPLQEVGVYDLPLSGDKCWDKINIRNRQSSVMQDIPVFRPSPPETERASLRDALGGVSSLYTDMVKLADSLMAATGSERYKSLRKLESKARSIGIRLGPVSGRDADFELPVSDINDLRKIAVLELLSEEAKRPGQSYEEMRRLRDFGITLLAKLNGDDNRHFRSIIADAKAWLNYNVQAAFAATARAELTSNGGPSPSFREFLRNFGYEQWTIDRILQEGATRTGFLARMTHFLPARPWKPIDAKLKALKPSVFIK